MGSLPQYPQPYGFVPSGPVLSGWWRRVGATAIDWLLTAVPSFLVLVAVGDVDDDALAASSLLSSAVSVGVWLWLTYLKGTRGQSVGYRVTGIRLVRQADGRHLGFLMAVVRDIVHIVDALPCYLGFLWPLWDRNKQTFADKIVGTLVIRTDPVPPVG